MVLHATAITLATANTTRALRSTTKAPIAPI